MIEVELPGARVAFTTRQGGVSEGPYRSANLGILTDDDREAVLRNRELAAERLGLDPAAIRMGLPGPRHDHPGLGLSGDAQARTVPRLPEADGHTTALPAEPLLVLVADCLPVALASDERVAMVHCGWRGLAGGILDRALEGFLRPGRRRGRARHRAVLLRGRARGARSVRGRSGGGLGGRMLSLRAVAAARLRAGGVEAIEDVDLCTACNEDLFFSHRRDHGVTGRQAGIAWRPA